MVNRHYEDSGSTIVPYNSRDTDCRKVRLLKDQKSYEAVASRRARLPDKVLERMWELSPDDDPHVIRRIAWLFTNIGRHAGLRIQEYGMDSCVVIKYCVLPDGTKVMRAFAVKDLLFYDEDGVLPSGLPANRESVEAVGLFFTIQRTGKNRQTHKFAPERLFLTTAVRRVLWKSWRPHNSWVLPLIPRLAFTRRGEYHYFGRRTLAHFLSFCPCDGGESIAQGWKRWRLY
mmetsp:Transcript_28323/g.67487  ORF Transcript_28323/g.67487 Transcript_28323/m.67487 type:complete len:230 (-) Transcript_28323:226-915(-)